MSIHMLVNGVMPIDVSSWVNCDSYSSNSTLRLFCTGVGISWWGGLKVSDVTVLDIIFFKVILLA